MPTMLIIGVSSKIGSAMASYFKDDFRIIGTYASNIYKEDGVQAYKAKIEDEASLHQLIKFFKPEYIIYAVGTSTLTQSHEDSKKSELLNSIGLMSVARACEVFNSKLIYFSSAHVFSGGDYTYSEKDNPVSNTYFGNSKATAEFYLQKSYLNYLILRVPNVFGFSYSFSKNNFLDYVELSYAHKQKIMCDNFVKTGWVSTDYLCLVLDHLIKEKYTNLLLNISSTDYLTQYEWCKKYFQSIKRQENLLQALNRSYPSVTAMKSQRGIDKLEIKLDMHEAKSLGVEALNSEKMIQQYFKLETKLRLL